MAPDLKLLQLDGDGIDPEIMAATIAVLEAVRPALTCELSVERAAIGFAALKTDGTTIPDTVIVAAKAADGVLLGPVSHNAYPPREEGGLNPSGVLRRNLELYANIRPARLWPGIDAPARRPLDLIVVRENLEGFYADRNMFAGGGEFSPEPGIALAVRKVTEKASLRIAEAAFALAETRHARKVTAIHKANVMRLSDGLFLDCVRRVAERHPEITYDEMLVDAAAAHLVREPDRFDVLVTTNMFGDILSDLASELSGGLGLAGSLNVGPDAVAAQAQHGSAPDIAGQDAANPTSMILSLAMLLRHFKQNTAADQIIQALGACLAASATRTRDLGGALGTQAFTQTLIHHIAKGAS